MSTVDVSPRSLRDAGMSLVETRSEDLVGNGNVQLLHGFGQDRFVSLGGFPMGVECQHRITELYSQAVGAYERIYQDLLALASALLIVADLYHSTDQEAALRFAFHLPGAGISRDRLPHWIDPSQNSVEFDRQRRGELARRGDGPLPTGWTERTSTSFQDGGVIVTTQVYNDEGKLVGVRRHVTGPDGSEYTRTESYDDTGNVVGSQVYQQLPGGATSSRSYDKNGKEIGAVVYTPGANGGGRTEHYEALRDADNQVILDRDGYPKVVLVREEVHLVTLEYGPHGATTGNYHSMYQSNVYSYEDGNRTAEHTETLAVGAQPAAPETGDAITRSTGELLADTEEAMEDPDRQRYLEYTMHELENDGIEVGEHGEIPYGDVSRDHNNVLWNENGAYRLNTPEELDRARSRGELPNLPTP